jgi:DNA-binding MarR family transcriptional regulator
MGAFQVFWETRDTFRMLSGAPGGVRLTDLAAGMRITKQSMAATIDQLEEKGYVERIADPEDGRAKLVFLTARGLELVRVFRKFVREIESDFAARLGAERFNHMKQALIDLTISLHSED